MIVIRYCGGLGNQMFQYAMQYSLTRKYPSQVIKGENFHYNIEHEHNGFELDNVFKIKIKLASKADFRKVYNGLIYSKKCQKLPKNIKRFILHNFQNKYLSIMNRIFRKKAKKTIYDDSQNNYVDKIDELQNGDWYLRGFWQRTDYFEPYRDELINIFSLESKLSDFDKKLLKKLSSKEVVAVHVRGGDFLNAKYNLCDISYYKKALDIINPNNLPLVIFTDDVEYAKNFFKNYTIDAIISHDITQSKIDMYMMSKAKSIVISNSTFSFWGAYLSTIKSQEVVAPRYASWDGKQYRLFPVRKKWIIVDNSNERN
ncbi:TPA: alpha-1,2-fucosyltransferase [Candidatus Ventrenecus stercoripullorum]|nr:alpha-1,2-fucosyltransferase [Candidatus Ventrenecus stercoripullorum]